MLTGCESIDVYDQVRLSCVVSGTVPRELSVSNCGCRTVKSNVRCGVKYARMRTALFLSMM